MKVTLKDGPFDGQEIESSDGRTPLIIEGGDVPEGMVARYRPTREPGVFAFKGYDKIVAKLPSP
jgi:hypothetical protein